MAVELQVQQQVGNAGVMKFSYVGSSTSRAPIQTPANVSTVLGPTQTLPFPQMGFAFNMIESIGHMSYNAFQAQYTKHYSSGLAIRSSFTWSKNINVGCASYWEGCNIQDPYDMRSNRSVDDVDVPIVFTLSALYQLPFGAGKQFANTGVKSKLFGDGKSMGMPVQEVAEPFTPTINFDNANSNGASNCPDVTGSTLAKDAQRVLQHGSVSVPAPHTYGNEGRNTFVVRDNDIDSSAPGSSESMSVTRSTRAESITPPTIQTSQIQMDLRGCELRKDNLNQLEQSPKYFNSRDDFNSHRDTDG